MIELYYPIFHIDFCERFDKTDLADFVSKKPHGEGVMEFIDYITTL